MEKVSVAFGGLFSSSPPSGSTVPSPQSIVPESRSSQPGSVAVPKTVTGEFSSTGAVDIQTIVGGSLQKRKAPIRVSRLSPGPRYWPVYQKVQSSTGSTLIEL